MSNKYIDGKIYSIRNKNDSTLVYIGSTCQDLHNRFYGHKINANNEKFKGYNMLLYQKMWETDVNEWYIELYEEYPCESKEQLNKKEGLVIRE